MSEGGEAQAPVPQSRPQGSSRSQQAACTSEDLGVRRSTRSRSNVAPTPPTETRSRKAGASSGKLGAASGKLGSSGRRQSAHGGEADPSDEGWGVLRTRESISTYTSRVKSHLCEYQEACKAIRRLREELRCARARAGVTPKRKKAEVQAHIKKLLSEVEGLEERRVELLETSGPFKEKLVNEERFKVMEENKNERLMGLQPDSQVDEEEEMDGDQQPDPPGGLRQQQQAPYSGPPAQQPAVSPADSGEDSDSSCQGGALMAQIRMLESPVCPQNLVFGDELPDEAPGGKKKKKTKRKQQEVVSYIYTPLPVTRPQGQLIVRAPLPSPCSVVDSVQRCGESTDTKRAQSSMPVCSSRDGAEKAVRAAQRWAERQTPGL